MYKGKNDKGTRWYEALFGTNKMAAIATLKAK